MGAGDWLRRLFGGKPKRKEIHEDLLEVLSDQMSVIRALHARQSLAPTAASMNLDGVVTGTRFTLEKGCEGVSIGHVLDHFAERLQRAFGEGRIRAAGIFFHGCSRDGSVRPAHSVEEANALVAWLEHETGQVVEAVIPYRREWHPGGEQWKYDPPVFHKVPVATARRDTDPDAASGRPVH